MIATKIEMCTYPGCLCIGHYKPLVHVRMPDNDKTFTFDFQHCRVCEKHKQTLKLEDIIGGKVFAQLIKLFKEKFIHPPKKEHCTLEWENTSIPSFVKGIKLSDIPLIRN